jgi:hypothetical protein
MEIRDPKPSTLNPKPGIITATDAWSYDAVYLNKGGFTKCPVTWH